MAGSARSRRTLVAALAIAGMGLAGLALAFSGSDLLRGIGERLAQDAQRVVAFFGGRSSAPAPKAPSTVQALSVAARTGSAIANPDPMTTRNASGWLRTSTRSGSIDQDNTFFQPIGTNGRSCASCHLQSAAWSMTPNEIRTRFASTGGTDPLFRTNDGSNAPNLNVSTVAARRIAYSMLLNRGVIRVGIGIPADAEFTLADVDDPYHYASAAELSLFRRPLPSTNLAFLTGIMWDGRETQVPFLPPMHAGQDSDALNVALVKQASDATIGHAQGIDPTPEQLADIVAFESGLTTAQIRDDVAGLLNEGDAIGGPRILANQRFYVGINDTLGADPTGALFDQESMGLFGAWTNASGSNPTQGAARAAIARGEALFNQKPLTITGVAGLNDALGLPSIPGTCSSCHNAPNIGNHTVGLPLNIGIADASRRTSDMPLYTLRNNTTGETVQTTDPGLALITGKWADIGKFKGPVLRGLAARPPYFHNGSATTLDDVVDFYDTRFAMNLSAQEKQDLVAFLKAL
jgi:cytochrome c peroxidase